MPVFVFLSLASVEAAVAGISGRIFEAGIDSGTGGLLCILDRPRFCNPFCNPTDVKWRFSVPDDAGSQFSQVPVFVGVAVPCSLMPRGAKMAFFQWH